MYGSFYKDIIRCALKHMGKYINKLQVITQNKTIHIGKTINSNLGETGTVKREKRLSKK